MSTYGIYVERIEKLLTIIQDRAINYWLENTKEIFKKEAQFGDGICNKNHVDDANYIFDLLQQYKIYSI